LAEVKGDFELAEKVLDTYFTHLPIEKFPFAPWQFDYDVKATRVYHLCGNVEKMQKYANFAIKTMEYHINVLKSQWYQYELMARYYGPHHHLADLYKMLGQYDMAKFYLEKLADAMQSHVSRAEQQGNRDNYSYLLGQQSSIRLQAKMLIIEQLEAEEK